MPTGMTCIIGDGANFNQFVWRVARQFGALIDLRDEATDSDIPLEIKPSPYHKDELAASRARLVKLGQMNAREIQDACATYNHETRTQREKYEDEKAALRSKYEAMLQKCEAFVAPTPEHEGLKALMISQIKESLAFDCSEPRPPALPLEPLRWLEIHTENARQNIEYHEKEMKAEHERCRLRTEWIQSLDKAVPLQIFKHGN